MENVEKPKAFPLMAASRNFTLHKMFTALTDAGNPIKSNGTRGRFYDVLSHSIIGKCAFNASRFYDVDGNLLPDSNFIAYIDGKLICDVGLSANQPASIRLVELCNCFKSTKMFIIPP